MGATNSAARALAKGAGGQFAPPLDARQPLRPHRLDRLTPCHRQRLGAEQLVVELPASQVVEGEGFLVLSGRIFQREVHLEPLPEKGPDRGLEKVRQVPEGEGLLSLQGGQGRLPWPCGFCRGP
jgi:hypothetical protein